MGYPCSQEYWQKIIPIFQQINFYRFKGFKWAEIPNKDTAIYKEILIVFKEELSKLLEEHEDGISLLTKYIVGKNDYYKVISNERFRLNFFNCFNIFGTLNLREGESTKSSRYNAILPTRLVDISFKNKSNNTLIITFNNDWQFSFRIHSADTYVKASLKFDIKIIKMSKEIKIMTCSF